MKVYAGLWIDHRKAVIVFITDKKEKTLVLKSSLGKMIQHAGNLHSIDAHGHRDLHADDIVERDVKGQLSIYYDSVIPHLRDAESILIFGPGETKRELIKRIKQSNLKGNIIEGEPADKMTDRQIAAKVRAYFLIHK